MAASLSAYRYTIEVYKLPSQQFLGAVAVEPDWEPAIQWTWLSALRRNPDLAAVPDYPESRVEPSWDPNLGSPYVRKLTAIISSASGGSVAEEIPLEYFKGLAQRASSDFVDQHKLADGEMFHYRVCAYYAEAEPRPPERTSGPRFAVRSAPVPLAIDERSLDDLLSVSLPHEGSEGELLPVFIPRHVLVEAAELMRGSHGKETGGILIGHMHRDRICAKLFLEVTAQVPARHTEQKPDRLTFTAHTWTAVDRAIALRDRGELYLGWWHTHPAAIGGTQGPGKAGAHNRQSDTASGDFFSALDVALHRTVFARAYSIALVLSESNQRGTFPSIRLYGWYRGLIVERGFHVLGATNWQAPAAVLVREDGGWDGSNAG